MATSESEDFESADEEFEPDKGASKLQGTETADDKTSLVSDTIDVDEHQSDNSSTPSPCISEQLKEKCTLDTTNTVNNTAFGSDESDKSCFKGKGGNTTSDCEHSNEVVDGSENSDRSGNIKDNASKAENCLDDDAENTATEKKEISCKINRRRERQQRNPKESKIGQSGTKKLGTRVAASSVEIFDHNAPESETTTKEEIANVEKEEPIKISSGEQGNLKKPEASTEEFTSVFDKLAKNSQPNEATSATQSGGWGWGSWGSSLLSSATASVSTLTSHVSQGLSTVIDTVEGGLGAPDPEELARQDLEAEKIIAEIKEPTPEEDIPVLPDATDIMAGGDGAGLFQFGQLISGVSQLGKIVENTGAKVLSGGLDTLEVIGKKTMAVLQDGDPGLKKKRALFKPDGPILSQALREAKDKAEEEAKLVEEKQAARKVHFETLFDDYQGLIHLEALEMLGRQCEMKLQSSLLGLSGAELVATQERLQAVRDECLLPDPDDVPDEPNAELEEKLTNAFDSLAVSVTAEKLLKVWSNVQSGAVVEGEGSGDEADTLASMHEKAVAGLAQLTASCVEQFHRAGELLLVHEQRNPTQEATHLMQVTLLESSMIEQLASSYCEALNSFGEPAQPIITKVFLEASNSSTYVQDAFQLLVPVLQIGAV